MAERQEGGPKKITINVKTPKEKQSVEIEENATIKDVSKITMATSGVVFTGAVRCSVSSLRLAHRQPSAVKRNRVSSAFLIYLFFFFPRPGASAV